MASFPQPSGAQPVRPPLVGSTDPPLNFGPPLPVQFRPVDLTQQSHQFQFQPMQGMASPIAGVLSHPQFVLPAQQIIPRPNSLQSVPTQYIQPNISPGIMQSQQNFQYQSNHLQSLGGGGVPLSSSYTFSTSYEHRSNAVNPPLQYQPVSQMRASLGLPFTNSGDQNSAGLPATNSSVSTTDAQPIPTQNSSDWQEHTSSNGRRYYYNKQTRESSWEKPVELMTPIERADSSTAWKEYTSADGKKYYYNKLTRQSKWRIPAELKVAREQAENTGLQTTRLETSAAPLAPIAVTLSSSNNTTSNSTSLATSAVGSSPFSVSLVNSVNPMSMMALGSPSIATVPSLGVLANPLIGTTMSTNATITLNVTAPITPIPASSFASTAPVEDTMDSTATTTTNDGNVPDRTSSQELEESKSSIMLTESIHPSPQEEKPIVEEPFIYANKQEAKNAFKALLESANIASDWTWEQAMRVIINDKRYGALKTLGERKQVFKEFLGEKKIQEVEDRRNKQKKAREDFTKMLEESKELASSTQWRKAEDIFESDVRFHAIERAKDREDLFESYIKQLRRKERAKAAEEHKRNIMEYRAFLESCNFIKANSQWRKIQDRLEIDERCSRLDKFDRLKIFEEYVNDLEKLEEEQQKIQKEQLRKEERKKRDDFRKLMEEHVAAGILTAKTHWRDYFMEVKDLPSYLAVASNTSGATPKDLFEDVTEELEKQYHEDKILVKDAIKMGKILLTSSSTFESFKADISVDGSLQIISEINLKLIFKELLEKLWDKEEKEAKKRQRLADNFSNFLSLAKEISASSTWEECKSLIAGYQQYSSAVEESFMRETFEKYVEHLQEKAIEKERKRDEERARKEKEREERRKERKEKEKDREKEKGKNRSRKEETESDNMDVINSPNSDGKSRGKDKDRKQRKHHRSHRHNGDSRKSRKRSSESDGESRYRKQKRDQDGSRMNSSYEDLEDGEL